jgi:hypothetical protein
VSEAPEPVKELEFLISGLAARVLARHLAIRRPGTRDASMIRELLTIVESAGRATLAARFRAGLEKEHHVRASSGEARVSAASCDLTRLQAVRASIVDAQPAMTRRPELLIRLAMTAEAAHDVARMVTELHVPRPDNLTNDGTLLKLSRSLREQADASRILRARLEPDVLLAALADELDHAADGAAAFERGARRVLALERCFEAARQIHSVVIRLGDVSRITVFAEVFERLVKLNRLLGPSSVESERSV